MCVYYHSKIYVYMTSDCMMSFSPSCWKRFRRFGGIIEYFITVLLQFYYSFITAAQLSVALLYYCSVEVGMLGDENIV